MLPSEGGHTGPPLQQNLFDGNLVLIGIRNSRIKAKQSFAGNGVPKRELGNEGNEAGAGAGGVRVVLNRLDNPAGGRDKKAGGEGHDEPGQAAVVYGDHHPDIAPRLRIPKGIPLDLVSNPAGPLLFHHCGFADELLPFLVGSGLQVRGEFVQQFLGFFFIHVD